MDVCAITVYMHTEPQKQTQQERNLRLWRYVENFISKLPHRCVPLLCLDANAHVGFRQGPGQEWRVVQSTAIGPFFPEPQNYNGGMLLSLLENQYMAAATPSLTLAQPIMDHLLGDMSQELITFVFQKAACKRFRVAMCSIWLQTVCSLFVIVPEETMCHYRLKLICNSNLPAWLPTRARLGMQSPLFWMRWWASGERHCSMQWIGSWRRMLVQVQYSQTNLATLTSYGRKSQLPYRRPLKRSILPNSANTLTGRLTRKTQLRRCCKKEHSWFPFGRRCWGTAGSDLIVAHHLLQTGFARYFVGMAQGM